MAVGAPTVAALDRSDPRYFAALVAQVGGVSAASKIANLKPETVQRYLKGDAQASNFHLNRLAKYVRESLGGVPGQPAGALVSSASVGQSAPVRAWAASAPTAAPEKASGFAAADSLADFLPADEAEEADPDNLSFFPPRPQFGQGPAPKGKAKPPTNRKPLDYSEAQEIGGLLSEAILPFCAEMADNLISRTNRDRAEAVIWYDLEEDEYLILADAMIGSGMQSGAAAQALRGMVWAWRRYQVGVITLPRMVKTVDHYAEHGGFVMTGIMPASLLRALDPRSRRTRPRKGAPNGGDQ